VIAVEAVFTAITQKLMKFRYLLLTLLAASVAFSACEPSNTPQVRPEDKPAVDPEPDPKPEPDPETQMSVTVVTGNSLDIKDVSAVIVGSYSKATADVYDYGFMIGTAESDMNQEISADGPAEAGEFHASLNGLEVLTTYYYKAYVILKDGDKVSDPFYGEVKSFTTKAVAPEMTVNVVTGSASGITVSSATISGSYSNASHQVRECGFWWGMSADRLDQVAQAGSTDTPFTATLSNLGESKTYYYRAYVILQSGDDISEEFLGQIKSFTTPSSGNPGTTGAVPQWAELPEINFYTSDTYKIDSQDNSLYYAWHICPDVDGPDGRLARNYTVCFSAQHHCPVWVAAPRHVMYVGSSGRTDTYGPDPDVPADLQYNSKSTGGGCNKGHMLGSQERTRSVATNNQVFYYTNIAPQLSAGFNTGGGGWNILEDYVDTQVCSDTLYIVIGCYFDKFTDGYGKTANPGKISYGGRTDVSIPTMFYYILLRTKDGYSRKSVKDCSASELKCAAFVRAHTNDLKGQQVTYKDLMSVADLEKITGFTYFPNVPNAPKTSFKASDWDL